MARGFRGGNLSLGLYAAKRAGIVPSPLYFLLQLIRSLLRLAR
jgi:hypothetical protein